MGKSSLLRAGVSARLRQLAARSVEERGSARYVPVVFSAWQGDPKADLIAALEAAVRPLLPGRRELALRRDALEDAIEDARRGGRCHPAGHPRPVRGALPVRDRRRRLRRRARALHQSSRPAGELPDLRPRGRLLADRPSLQGAHPERLRQLPASRLPRRAGRARRDPRTRRGIQRAPAGRRAALRGRDRARGRRARAGAPRARHDRRRRGTGRRRATVRPAWRRPTCSSS